MSDLPTLYIIQRASETQCEWWTGSSWSDDDTRAKLYGEKPDAAAETNDESATAEALESSQTRFA